MSSAVTKFAVCDDCGKSFASKGSMMRHRKATRDGIPEIDPVAKNHLCDDCGKGFASKRNMIRHRKAAHGVIPDPVTKNHLCDDCGKGFVNKHNVIRHRKVAHGVIFEKCPVAKNHLCDDCGKFFTLRKNLNRHRILHGHEVVSTRSVRNSTAKICERKNEQKLEVQKKRKTGAKIKQKVQVKTKQKPEVELQSIRFESEESFTMWKESNERTMRCRFIKSYTKRSKSGIFIVYVCNRSGYYKSRSIRRRPKFGSIKINSICPAIIKKRIIGSCIAVDYSFTHSGHGDCNKLTYMNRTASEINQIVTKLKDGLPECEKCKTCNHRFKCTCTDSSIRTDMCDDILDESTPQSQDNSEPEDGQIVEVETTSENNFENHLAEVEKLLEEAKEFARNMDPNDVTALIDFKKTLLGHLATSKVILEHKALDQEKKFPEKTFALVKFKAGPLEKQPRPHSTKKQR